jgi:hypothetical protein
VLYVTPGGLIDHLSSRLVVWLSRTKIMKSRADVYRQKADECERATARVTDPHIQARYREMSRQWHAMANRQQAIDEALAGIGTV